MGRKIESVLIEEDTTNGSESFLLQRTRAATYHLHTYIQERKEELETRNDADKYEIGIAAARSVPQKFRVYRFLETRRTIDSELYHIVL